MLSKFLLTCGVLALTLALRSVRHPVTQKLGALGVVATSFLTGWFLTGWYSVGVLFACFWLLLPWLDLLTRIRLLTLPIERQLRHRSPPGSGVFPALYDLTEEIEADAFEHVEDSGWDAEEYQQFFRLFYKADERLQAAVCLIEQHDLAFYYLALSSRGSDGKLWTTWNYPFSYSLQLAPEWRVNRLRGELGFLELLESHRDFLRRNHIGLEALEPLKPEALQEEIQKDLRAQVAHNLATGVLVQSTEGEVRYSWRGLFYLWFQFLRDLVRFS
ncbi:MAG TPA: hypothetical protein VGO11_01735 [Chthoniobacteraceae bacterium]|jgi:hypothetical protein|nr:hypothetical protein [Chthoniobacteraceae bacterium]